METTPTGIEESLKKGSVLPEEKPEAIVEGDKFDADDEKKMIQLTQKIRKSFMAMPPDVPKYGESTKFWESTMSFEDRGLKLGEPTIVNPAVDAHGARHPFRRDILDADGKEIGRWEKEGFVSPDGKTLYSVDESVYYFEDGRSETVHISLDRKNGDIDSISLRAYDNNGNNPDTLMTRYSYYRSANLDEWEDPLNQIELYRIDPTTKTTKSTKSQRISYRRPRQEPKPSAPERSPRPAAKTEAKQSQPSSETTGRLKRLLSNLRRPGRS